MDRWIQTYTCVFVCEYIELQGASTVAVVILIDRVKERCQDGMREQAVSYRGGDATQVRPL